MTQAHGRPLALVGPTASGKTALSLEIATRLDAEVISMDSRQVYRGMDVGTAKVGYEDRALVPHHGLDLVAPDERYSAGRFARDARRWMREIESRGRVPLLVGGTGFFLRALTEPIFREPPLDPERREALRRELGRLPTPDLLRWLERLDPERALLLRGQGGRQRLLRALELPLLSGRSLSWWHRHAPPEAPPVDPLTVVLEVPAELLRREIDARVGRMAEAGLVDEVRRLVASGFGEDAPGMSATGYLEILLHLRGEISLDEALDRIRANTRAYARRQRTWFRNQLPPDVLRLAATRPREELAQEIVAAYPG